MDDKTKAKYLLSEKAEKYLINKHGFWFYKNRMFGGTEGPYDNFVDAFNAFIRSEERIIEMVGRAKDGTNN